VRAASVKGKHCGAQEKRPHNGERQAVGNRNGNGWWRGEEGARKQQYQIAATKRWSAKRVGTHSAKRKRELGDGA
jgi:hypothetical protein